jgi:hypothetical protein
MNNTLVNHTVHLLNIVMTEWLSTGFGLEIGFIDHFNTRLLTTLYYSVIADLHTLQITTAPAKSFQSAITSYFPLTYFNIGDSSASMLNCTN